MTDGTKCKGCGDEIDFRWVAPGESYCSKVCEAISGEIRANHREHVEWSRQFRVQMSSMEHAASLLGIQKVRP